MPSKCIIMHLSGPMCSWGETGAWKNRSTAMHPSRSSIIGILCAALGIDRNDSKTQTRMSRSFEMVITSSDGISKIEDFHTIMAGRDDGKKKVFTGSPRVEELNRETTTILSRREYLCNAFYTVFLIPKEDCSWNLDDIVDALKKPRYTPYLGRKSCPLAFPMAPSIIYYEKFLRVVEEESFKPFKQFIDERRLGLDNIYVYSSIELEDDSLIKLESVQRRDEIADRKTWSFKERREFGYAMERQ